MDSVTQRYLDHAHSYGFLTAKEEKELAFHVSNYRGIIKQRAREKLANYNLKLVIKIAFHFQKMNNQKTITIMDFINAGNVGLMTAIDLYDPKQYKTRFTTYAVPWIKQKMYSLLSKNSIAHIPSSIMDDSRKLNRLSKNYTDSKAMKALNISKKQLYRVKNSNISSFSMDMPIKSDNDSIKTYKEMIPDTKQVSVDDTVSKYDKFDFVNKALEILDPIGKDIIKSQYLLPEKIKLQTIGEKHNLSGERIRQIRDKCLKKLKRELKKKGIENVCLA